MAIVLDFESIALPGALDLVEPSKAPSNYKDPEKIAAYIREADRRQVEMASVYPYTARIVALGWCWEGEDIERVELCKTEADERAVLREFLPRIWDGMERRVIPLVTFGGRRFDLPLLAIRSRFLGLSCPHIDVRKFYSPHPDMLDKLTDFGTLDYRSLRWFAKAHGFPMDDAFSGAEIAQLVESDNWDAVRSHCAWDVRTVRLLAEFWGVLKAPIRSVA